MSEDETFIEISGEAVAKKDLMKKLALGTTIREVTVGRKEVRQRFQYNSNEYFLSVKLDFNTAWDLYEDYAKANPNNTKEIAEFQKTIKDHIGQEIMNREMWMSGVILHLQLKDKMTTWPRETSNPAVTAKTVGEAVRAVAEQESN